MGVRLRMSEAEQRALDNMPPPGMFNTAARTGSSSFPSASASSGSSNGRYAFMSEQGGDIDLLRKQSYQEMRDRNRDRMPNWARKGLNAVKKLFEKDPFLTYVLPEGPPTWMYQWLVYGRKNPVPLWDARTFGPKASYPWGSADQLCSILNSTDDVALVGNGPLSQEQREEISRAGKVVRFNALNNRCARFLISPEGLEMTKGERPLVETPERYVIVWCSDQMTSRWGKSIT